MEKVVVFDLDDTLMAEAEFVDSAREAIALEAKRRIDCGLWRPDSPDWSVVNGIWTDWMKEMYRNHRPQSLPFLPGAEQLLSRLKESGVSLALITDGRVKTQTAKIEALGLLRFIEADNILISESTGHDKLSPFNFRRMMELHPDCRRFYYIGDNPAKDFIQTNRLGWTTIALRDLTGRNIHPQNFNDVEPMNLPRFIVDNIADAFTIIMES